MLDYWCIILICAKDIAGLLLSLLMPITTNGTPPVYCAVVTLDALRYQNRLKMNQG